MVSEKPVAKRGEGVDVHPLVLGEALAHAQDGEEVPRHRPVQLGDGRRLTDNACGQSKTAGKGPMWQKKAKIQLTWRDLGPVKNPPEEAPPP